MRRERDGLSWVETILALAYLTCLFADSRKTEKVDGASRTVDSIKQQERSMEGYNTPLPGSEGDQWEEINVLMRDLSSAQEEKDVEREEFTEHLLPGSEGDQWEYLYEIFKDSSSEPLSTYFKLIY